MTDEGTLISHRQAMVMAAGAILLALVGALVLNHVMTPAVDLTKHAQATGIARTVQVTTRLSLQQAGKLTEVVADVTVLNTGDKALAYVGIACSAPANVAARSTRPDPPAPPYSASAIAVRAKVLQNERERDEYLTFIDRSSGAARAKAAGCDETAPPILPPHKALAYTLTGDLAFDGVPYADPPTTDVVTTLKVGALPRPGSPPVPIVATDTIEVRTPLQQVSQFTMTPKADLATVSRWFDEAMKNPTLSSWVDSQDAASWGPARLTSSYAGGSDWKLIAFNRHYALPLTAAGASGTVTVQVPSERASQPAVTDAVIPPDATSASRTDIPFQDLYVGDLVLPTGKVMVGDPVYSDNMLIFDLGLRGGRYPVHVVTEKPRYLGAEFASPAWEVLMLSNVPVTHWVPAVPVGHSAQELKPGEVFQWGTDGGTGGFASPEAMKPMDASLDSDLALYDLLGQREEANAWLWGFLTVDSPTGANVFACTTGGDGGFPVLLGLDAQNHPAALLSDFGVLNMNYSGIFQQ
jgi:Protein of unknown function (DUF4241)